MVFERTNKKGDQGETTTRGVAGLIEGAEGNGSYTVPHRSSKHPQSNGILLGEDRWGLDGTKPKTKCRTEKTLLLLWGYHKIDDNTRTPAALQLAGGTVLGEKKTGRERDKMEPHGEEQEPQVTAKRRAGVRGQPPEPSSATAYQKNMGSNRPRGGKALWDLSPK